MGDELNLNLEAYGHNKAKSPNIDQLARNDSPLNSANVQYPVCAPVEPTSYEYIGSYGL